MGVAITVGTVVPSTVGTVVAVAAVIVVGSSEFGKLIVVGVMDDMDVLDGITEGTSLDAGSVSKMEDGESDGESEGCTTNNRADESPVACCCVWCWDDDEVDADDNDKNTCCLLRKMRGSSRFAFEDWNMTINSHGTRAILGACSSCILLLLVCIVVFIFVSTSKK